jgi:hypothetical protein
MPTEVKIISNTGIPLKVNGEGEVSVVVHTHPPINEELASLPFRQYFTDDGSASGSNNMIVAGSLATPLPFYIKASPDYDIYIKYISIAIGDGGSPNLNLFGALPALTNGVTWYWTTQELGEYELHDGIKTNLEFVRLGGATAGIGTGTDAFLADVSGGGSEKSYLPNIDMAETFGLPFGLRLRKGTTDQVTFKVRDALAGLVTFNMIGYGIRI